MNNFITKATRVIKRVGISMIFVFQIIISTIFIVFRNNLNMLLILIAVINVVIVLIIVIINYFYNKSIIKYNIALKNDFVRIFQS
ncbi:MAG TPA: hypothetical protein PK771_01640, partial [Spirochaetota bacterium]|nr:hypothetical protein [Spirochaetota bacterium]